MSLFLRLLEDVDKGQALLDVCRNLRRGDFDTRHFELNAESFKAVPGRPFSYWLTDKVRSTFSRMAAFHSGDRIATVTNQVSDDSRYVRIWWEIAPDSSGTSCRWVNYAKGASFSPFYCDVYLQIRWDDARQTYHGFLGTEHRPLEKPASVEHFFRPGLTWLRRTNGLSFRVMPSGCIFSNKGPAAFVEGDDPRDLMALSSLVNSRAFAVLVAAQLARVELAQSFEVGLIQQTPVPDVGREERDRLSSLARRAWSLMRRLDTFEEVSHAFLLPEALGARAPDFNRLAVEAELRRIQAEIDTISFGLYEISASDCAIVQEKQDAAVTCDAESSLDGEVEDEIDADPVTSGDGLLSWAVGVAFGRFDLRIATGERAAPPEPEPFDPLPVKSPGMLPDGATPFHTHAGILVDDVAHRHDLARVMEEVLARVDSPGSGDLRRWLQTDFFPFHLQRYSKSRRKAPIYWPVSTGSSSYTLWIYYPSLSSQTLYTAVNDFVEPKLKQVGDNVASLRNKGIARSRDEEKRLEVLQALELELIELRDSLLKLSPTYEPNHDDGVQISAAPLWPLFRHKPWQKLLKETWAKLEKGEYDWSHMAMNYWPDRVREKCKTDKSLAIAHGLEGLYVAPEVAPKKTRGKKKGAEA